MGDTVFGGTVCKDNYAIYPSTVKRHSSQTRDLIGFKPPISCCSVLNQHGQKAGSRHIYLYKQRRHLLYGILAASSSKLLHQRHQLEQVLVPKETSAVGYFYEGIWCRNRSPTRRNRTQGLLNIVEIHSVLAPVVAISDQPKLLTFEWMMRMDNFERRIGNVTMPCS
jgi:hypothetical protein